MAVHRRLWVTTDPIRTVITLTLLEIAELLEDDRWIPRIAGANKDTYPLFFRNCSRAATNYERMRTYHIILHDT